MKNLENGKKIFSIELDNDLQKLENELRFSNKIYQLY